MSKNIYKVTLFDRVDANSEKEAIEEFRKMVMTIEDYCFKIIKVATTDDVHIKDFM